MGVKPWDTSNPRIRCLLTPLILVVADVSAAYEFLLKAFSRIREGKNCLNNWRPLVHKLFKPAKCL